MIACHRWRCPTCGFFGLGARRRALKWAARAHVAWAAALALASRRRRADADGLMALSDCRIYPGATKVRELSASGWLHHHVEGQHCTDECLYFPPLEQVTTIFLAPDPAEVERWSKIFRDDMQAQVDRARAIIVARGNEQAEAVARRDALEDWALQEYDTADVAAEVIGELSYEEQSEMIGDPAAEVIMRETED